MLDEAPSPFWQALEQAIAGDTPRAAVEELRARGGLEHALPELEGMFGIPQRAEKHPEIDAGLHSLMALEQASLLTARPEVRFGALVHDFGKLHTMRSAWPSHRGHEERGVPVVETVCRRLGAPESFRELGILAARWHGIAHRAAELRPGTLLDLIETWNGIASPERLEWLVIVGTADKRGRTGLEQVAYPPGDVLRQARHAAAAVDPQDPERLRQERIAAIARLRAS